MRIIRKIIYPLTILLFIAIIICIIYLKNNLNKTKYDYLEVVNDIEKEPVIEEQINKYTVDIKGAVNSPGVYQLESNLTVNDAIKIAGGLTKDADTSIINLAKKITDEMVIIIYTKEEVKNSNVVDTVIKIVEKECICPNIQNDGCLNDSIKDNISNKNEELVNINTATLEELETISGIGESKAKSIIEYRQNNGLFEKIEDIMNVEGIGESLYAKIKIYITT